jgi:hypothetical protein
MRSLGMIRLLWILTGVAAAISAYGWWFHFSVGPTHGAGQELGIVAGVLAVGTSLLALRCASR